MIAHFTRMVGKTWTQGMRGPCHTARATGQRMQALVVCGEHMYGVMGGACLLLLLCLPTRRHTSNQQQQWQRQLSPRLF